MAACKQVPFQPDVYYHVYNHANGFENLFRCNENYRYFLQRYADFIEPVAYTYAYCLLPNHIHFLIKMRNEEEVKTNLGEPAFQKFETFGKLVSKQFARLFSSYTQAYNKMYDRRGSLFVQNFKRKAIDNRRYLQNALHYIHWNPVGHRLCENIHDWQWSSFHAYDSEKKTRVATGESMSWFGSKKAFKDYHLRKPDQSFLMEMEL